MSEANKQREEIEEFVEVFKGLPSENVQQLLWMARGMKILQESKKPA